MTGIVDYGVGNLFSLASSLKAGGAESFISSDPGVLKKADKLILPGVGAFGDAAKKLRAGGLDLFLKDEVKEGKPLLGICLGMQLLFEKSEEFGEHRGLGFLKGQIIAMEGRLPASLPIPHMGWNGLRIVKPHPYLRGIKDGDCVYFVHSFFAADCKDSLIADTEYGIRLPAFTAYENVSGCQFHPEKSGPVGLSILKAFAEE